VIGMTGYAGAFCGGGPSYRAVFPDVSVDGGTCASVGVLGTAVSMRTTALRDRTILRMMTSSSRIRIQSTYLQT